MVFWFAEHYDSTHRTVARFDEDLDLTTTTLPGGEITGHNLSAWREGWIPAPYNMGTDYGAYIAWGETNSHNPPRLTISHPEGLGAQWRIDEESILVMSLAHEYSAEPIDFTVRLGFADGEEAALPLSTFATLGRTPNVKRFKLGSLENMVNPILVQRFELPLATFIGQTGLFPHELRSIQLVFDMTPEGAFYIDELAISEEKADFPVLEQSPEERNERERGVLVSPWTLDSLANVKEESKWVEKPVVLQCRTDCTRNVKIWQCL